MNGICERALEYYIKKLENDNKTLREFANKVKSITFDFDGARAEEVRTLVRIYDCVFEEE